MTAELLAVQYLGRQYLDMLKTPPPPPSFRIRDNAGVSWLGRTTWRPAATEIEIQRSVVSDPRTLERVVAHEIVHHHAMAILSREEKDDIVSLLRIGIRPPEHGKSFFAIADRINAIKGAGFVTENSDEQYVTARRGEYLVLVVPLSSRAGVTEFGYQWAVRLGPKAQAHVARMLEKGGRTVRTTDERWTRGPKIGSSRYAVPQAAADAETLSRMHAAAAS